MCVILFVLFLGKLVNVWNIEGFLLIKLFGVFNEF